MSRDDIAAIVAVLDDLAQEATVKPGLNMRKGFVSEDRGLPIVHGGGIDLTMAFVIGQHTGVVPDGPQCG